MSGNSALAEKNANIAWAGSTAPDAGDGKPDVKSMEYHRQMLQSRMADEEYAAPAADTTGTLR